MRRRIRDIEGDLPPSGTQPPIINDDFSDVYGMFYAVTVDGLSATEQRDLATKLRRGLVAVDGGVAKVEVQGGLAEEEIIISVPSARLTELGGLPPDQILGIIADETRFLQRRDQRRAVSTGSVRSARLCQRRGH